MFIKYISKHNNNNNKKSLCIGIDTHDNCVIICIMPSICVCVCVCVFVCMFVKFAKFVTINVDWSIIGHLERLHGVPMRLFLHIHHPINQVSIIVKSLWLINHCFLYRITHNDGSLQICLNWLYIYKYS